MALEVGPRLPAAHHDQELAVLLGTDGADEAARAELDFIAQRTERLQELVALLGFGETRYATACIGWLAASKETDMWRVDGASVAPAS